MKKLSIILVCVLVAIMSCKKEKEIIPEIPDENTEIITVGVNDVHVQYTRTDHAELNRAVFHYCPADADGNAQQFEAAEMTREETFFELALNDLLSDTLYWYYYELFPNNGDAFTTVQKTFHTQASDTPEPPTPPTPSGDFPEGAVNGLFTINENGDQVYFSKGNLQYQASTGIWRFAEHQYDYVGGYSENYQNPGEVGNVYENSVKCSNNNISTTYSGWIDLFGWATSGWNNNNHYYHPYDYESTGWTVDGYGYGYWDGEYANYSMTGDQANCDWGVYNAISNGGNEQGLWRTLSDSEWNYVMQYRSNAIYKRSSATVEGTRGTILLPDAWILPSGVSFTANASDYEINNYNTAQWNLMENAGAVFFPWAGQRSFYDGNIRYENIPGGYRSAVYWSSSHYSSSSSSSNEYALHPSLYDFNSNSFTVTREFGLPVRLVQNY